MRSQESTRFPKKVLERYAELLLRHVYQCGGRERYVPLAAIEDALGLEAALILTLCRTRLLGEVHVADRLHAEIEESGEFRTPVERHLLRMWMAVPHVRIRPELVRLTPEELIRAGKKHARAKKKRRKAARRETSSS